MSYYLFKRRHGTWIVFVCSICIINGMSVSNRGFTTNAKCWVIGITVHYKIMALSAQELLATLIGHYSISIFKSVHPHLARAQVRRRVVPLWVSFSCLVIHAPRMYIVRARFLYHTNRITIFPFHMRAGMLQRLYISFVRLSYPLEMACVPRGYVQL